MQKNEKIVIPDQEDGHAIISDPYNDLIFTIYPNLTHSHFTIDYILDGATPVLLEPYTISGIKVKTFIGCESGSRSCLLCN